LREPQERVPVAETGQKHGVSRSSIYMWKARFGSIDVSGGHRVQAQQNANARLKKLPAEMVLVNATLEGIPRRDSNAI